MSLASGACVSGGAFLAGMNCRKRRFTTIDGLCYPSISRVIPMALKGQELIDKVRSMDGASKTELTRACGYVTTRKDGQERLNFTGFYEAFLVAKGEKFGDAAAAGKAGRRLSFVTTTQFNGNLLIGKAYMAQLEASPGDAYGIKLLNSGRILLIPVEQLDEEEGEAAVEASVDSQPAAAAATPEVAQPQATQAQVAQPVAA